jgi:hypothetical protein
LGTSCEEEKYINKKIKNKETAHVRCNNTRISKKKLFLIIFVSILCRLKLSIQNVLLDIDILVDITDVSHAVYITDVSTVHYACSTLDLDAPLSLFLFLSSLSELLGDLLNGAVSTPVSTTTVVGRDLFFFGEWMDKKDGGGGVQSVRIIPPFRSISLNAGAVAAQRNSGIAARTHTTLTTTNHLEVVAGDVRSVRTHTIPPTLLYRASSHDHIHSIPR